MRLILTSIAISAFAVTALGQSQVSSLDPLWSAPWGTSYRQAVQTYLRHPPAKISRDERTGQVEERKGHFTVVRTERPFDVPAKMSYGFTLKDSLLGFILMSYIESDRIGGHMPGGRDSLWARLARAYGTPTRQKAEATYTQLVWERSGKLIVATRSNVDSRTLVVSLTPEKRAR